MDQPTESARAEEPTATSGGLTFRQRLDATWAPARERLAGLGHALSGGNWVYGVIAGLVIIALLLPPISLPRRLGLTGYTTLDADTPSLSHPDGLSVNVNFDQQDATVASQLMGTVGGPVDVNDVSLRVSLTSIPQAEFLAGNAGDDLRAALAALPAVLQVKSPYYQISTTSRSAGPAVLEVVIPNDAEPWNTLDLYTWTGSEWQWIGGTLDREREVLLAAVARLPDSVVVMQTVPVVPSIATVGATPGAAGDVLTELLVPAVYLGTDGMLLGRTPTPNADLASLLLVRNWEEGQPFNPLLLNDLLNDPQLQQEHIANIVTAAAGFSGVALDYQGVAVEQRDAYSAFVAALAQALHDQGMRLEVLVPAPLQDGTAWDSGGYNWPALGAAADKLLFPLPDTPSAYAAGGSVESLLGWAVGQVNRYRLGIVVSSLSTDVGSEARHVGMAEALVPFGQVSAPADATLQPGQEVSFSLAGQVTSIVRDEAAGTYAIAYRTAEGHQRTVWLGTPALLAARLDWAFRYHLSGVVVTDLNADGNFPGVADAVRGYRNAAQLTAPAPLEVVWTVDGPDEQDAQHVAELTQPDFTWTAPTISGTYTIAATVAGIERGATRLTVAVPNLAPSAAQAPTMLTNTASAGGTVTPAAAACMQAAFVTDVTVPDGTHFDNNEAFVKTWRLRNSGTCDWPADTVLVFASGTQMGSTSSVPVGAVAAGQTVDVSVNLTAPQDSGNFTGLWKLQVGSTPIPGGEVTVVIRAGQVAAAPAPIARGNFELGGHVRDMSFPYASLMHYAGMTWAKAQVRYPDDASGVIAAAHAQGFRIQISALGPATMVTQPGFEGSVASWVAGIAAAGADAIEVWNEPNIDREWQSGFIDPAAYTRLLCAAYSAIKAANPNTLVISAAPAPTGYFGGCGPGGCDDQPWVEGMYNAGAANCMDYIGAHHNAGATSPSARSGHPTGSTHHSWYFLPQTELYYNIFRGSRQLFYTEMGYASQEGVEPFPSNFSWACGNDNSEQAAWLAEAAQISANTGMVRVIIVWNVDYLQAIPGDPQNGYAIIRPGGSCPACDALHNVLGTR